MYLDLKCQFGLKLKETYAVHVLLVPVVIFCPQNQYGKIEEKYPFDVII